MDDREVSDFTFCRTLLSETELSRSVLQVHVWTPTTERESENFYSDPHYIFKCLVSAFSNAQVPDFKDGKSVMVLYISTYWCDA